MKTFPSILAVSGFVLAASVQTATAGVATPLTTTRVASGLTLPVFVTAPRADFNRLFIVEQRASAGIANRADIKILNIAVNPPVLSGVPFFTIVGVNTGNEEGLLGFAFHPDFFAAPGNVNRGAFFVYYTSGGNNHVVRYTTIGQDPLANYDSTSAQTIIDFNHPGASNHNGGWIGFGPDGYLYINTGDGGPGSGCDPNQQAQNINHFLGKVHRLDVSTDQNGGVSTFWGYTIPPTNPFAGAIPGLDEIWHIGLRNPWRAGFDRLTGDFYIGDVGQFVIEEIDRQPSGVGGLNFGWDCMEGFSCASVSCAAPYGCVCGAVGLTNPVTDYNQTISGRCAVTGGYVYRGPGICDLKGTYFFADYCSAEIWSMPAPGGAVTPRQAELAPGGGLFINQVTSFGEDARGELYIVDQGGEVFKIIPNGVPLVGDLNNDRLYTTADGDLLALALVDPAAYSALFPAINANITGDTNCDGLFDGLDIQPLVRMIIP